MFLFSLNAKKRLVINFTMLILGLIIGALACGGCSALKPSTKSQSMTVTALGLPAITVVTTTSMDSKAEGEDEHTSTQTQTNDVSPETTVTPLP